VPVTQRPQLLLRLSFPGSLSPMKIMSSISLMLLLLVYRFFRRVMRKLRSCNISPKGIPPFMKNMKRSSTSLSTSGRKALQLLLNFAFPCRIRKILIPAILIIANDLSDTDAHEVFAFFTTMKCKSIQYCFCYEGATQTRGIESTLRTY
jgi:hypothetical protein